MTQLAQAPFGPDRFSTTVLASVVHGFDTFIRQRGGNPADVFGQAGLAVPRQCAPSDMVFLDTYCQALDYAAHSTRTTHFGLWFGHQFAPSRLGLLGYLALSAPTLGDALDNLASFFSVHQDNSAVSSQIRRGVCVLEYSVDAPNLSNHRHDSELSLAVFCNLIKAAMGPTWAPTEVHFRHEAAAQDRQDHGQAFGCPVHFGRRSNALLFPASVLSTPMPDADSILFCTARSSLLNIQAEKTARTQTRNILETARQVIIHLLPQGYPSITAVAEELGCPPWTLQRRLADQNASHRQLVEETRQQQAVHYLQSGRFSVAQTAFMLGYAESSSFTRAFTRWHGHAPSSLLPGGTTQD